MKMKKILILGLVILLTSCVANDGQIVKVVSDEIGAQKGLGAHRIGVDSENGVVTLEGYVISEAKRKEVEQIAYKAEGVKEVRNRLQVRATMGADPTMNLCERVLKSLSAQGRGQTLDAQCEGQTVTLSGNVESEDAAQKAGKAVMMTPGVETVINLLTTAAAPSDNVVDQRVHRAIEMVNEYNLSYYVKGGIVFFTGWVPTADKLERVISVAKMVKGVRNVKSEVQVGGKVNF